MCGIVGVLSFGKSEPERKLKHLLTTMNDQIIHRGPDSGGVWVDGCVGFAHRRLAIIDLNERSAQPMRLLDGSLTITYNGEVYNFQELRRELEGFGHVFRTESDTEVLLHGYRQWGTALPERLRGMFAFGIWDAAEQELFLARDRFGKKPMVYAWVGDTFLFGSEAKSLLQWPGIKRVANPEIISDFMTFGYTPGARTAFAGIDRLPPAHCMLLSRKRPPHDQPKPKRYWRLAAIDWDKQDMDRDAAAGELLERFDESLKLRLVSDVPVGAFLSGGVDSSAVVARMSRMVSEPIKTFSVGFAIDGYDETAYAQEVADQYGTQHHSYMMDYGLIDILPRAIWHYGEPYSDSSALVSMALSELIREKVTVAVTGDGGDEIFLGYSRYLRFKNAIEPDGPSLANGPSANFHAFETVRDQYVNYIATFRDLQKEWGLGPALADQLFNRSADRLPVFMEQIEARTAMDVAARAEVETYLPDDLLVKADIAQMSASIEGRSPFLDHELADWAASLPPHLRVFERHGKVEGKALLKYAMEGDLSDDILYRKKQGFSVPVKHWLKNEIRELTGDLLRSQAFRERGYLRPVFVDWMLDQHFSDREDHGTRLWNLLNLELWHQTFTDGAVTGPLSLNLAAGGAGIQKMAS